MSLFASTILKIYLNIDLHQQWSFYYNLTHHQATIWWT